MNKSVTASDGVARAATGVAMIGWFIVHTVVWIGLVRLLPGDDFVEYPDLGALGLPWMRQFVIPLLVVLALQIILITRRGWWKPVLSDESRTTRKWLAIPPVIIVVIGLSQFISDGLSDAPTHYWIGMTLTMLLVGTTEELSFRGILLVGGRQVFGREWIAFLVSSALFGLFHLPNVILGQEFGPTVTQVVATAVIGSAFYCLRRVTGSIIPCIVLHAAYDWALIQSSAMP
jgi:membrane protease YdiL (CAAX protease family)